MNSIEYVDTLRESMIQQGKSKPEIVRSVSLACIGWPYVFGAWGEQCTPSGRKRRAREDHPTIVSKCQVLNGSKAACSGCKWFPGGETVRCFDCRGFTDWCLKQVDITIQGSGATSQWNTKANWTIQGPISEMPRDRVCCVFVKKDAKMQHTGLYLGDGSTCECSSGVQYFNPMKSKWTHYAIPAGLYDDVPVPTPEPPDPDKKPTLRKGDSGPYVTLAQTELLQRGYDLGSYGADGKFGAKTEAAVKAFQRDWGLTEDGIIGSKTWAMLESTPVRVLYSVIVPHLSLKDAEALAELHPGSRIEKEAED